MGDDDRDDVSDDTRPGSGADSERDEADLRAQVESLRADVAALESALESVGETVEDVEEEVDDVEEEVDDVEEEVDDVEDDVEDVEENVEDRTVHRETIERDLKRYVRRRMRRGKARGWGPYLVLLYGTVMTLGAFYSPDVTGGWAVFAMIVIWLSTLGLYVLMVLAGIGLNVLSVPWRLRDRIGDWRS